MEDQSLSWVAKFLKFDLNLFLHTEETPYDLDVSLIHPNVVFFVVHVLDVQHHVADNHM